MNYSQAVRVGNMLFLAGQVAIKHTAKIVGKRNVGFQTRQIFENMKSILKAAGATFDNIVDVTFFATDASRAADVREVLPEYFKEAFPVRTPIRVKQLADKDLMIEVRATAVLE